MVKKKVSSRKATGKLGATSSAAAYKQASDHRRVAEMMACGYEISDMAQVLGLHYNTIAKYRNIVIKQFWQETKLGYSEWLEAELLKLETARNSALAAFYEARNRHGETLQAGYLTSYAKLTGILHDILHIRDSQAAQMLGNDETDVAIVEVEIKNRQQAEAVIDGKVGFEDLLAMQEE